MPDFIRIFFNRFKEYVVLVLFLIISLALISSNENQKVKNIRLFALGVFASINSAITNISDISENTSYVRQLEKHNAELMLQVNRLRKYGLEYDELNNYLNFIKNSNADLISAKIVSRLVSKISGYFIISKGANEGIEKSMPVLTDNGLVGIVVDVADDYSSVRTYENSLFKVAVKNQRSNVDGILNWNGRNLVIKNVPTTDDMEIGDRIVVSELSSIIPPSIPIGVITDKESTISGLLSNIIVMPYAKLADLRNVLVLKVAKSSQLDSLELNLIRRN